MGILLRKRVNGYLENKRRKLLFFFIYVIINEGDTMKSFVKMILQVLKRFDYICIYCFYKIMNQVEDKQVLFLSDSRNELTGNFYYIYQEVKDDYMIKTHLYQNSKEKHHKRQLCKDMATAHYILVDDFYPIIYPIPLRKKTKLIQVWHAMGAFKTMGFARKQNHDRFSMTHRNYDATIVSSPSIRKDYAKAFRMDIDHVYSLGIPRTDVLFNQQYKDIKRKELYEKYPLLKEKKVILFAPTFRGQNIHHAYYDFDKIDFRRLKDSLSDEYVCIIKMHPFIHNQYFEELDSSFYIDLTCEREINDLLLVSDVLITDYSSVIFEASLLDIHTIFYAYDLDDYISSRDFFYPYETYTYGPVVKNQDELENAIKHSFIDQNKLNAFKEQFTISCDGHSSKRFVNTLLKENN